jgi:hypothetical protein
MLNALGLGATVPGRYDVKGGGEKRLRAPDLNPPRLRRPHEVVAEIVQYGEPAFSRICGHSIFRPSFTLPFSEPISCGFLSVPKSTRMLA